MSARSENSGRVPLLVVEDNPTDILVIEESLGRGDDSKFELTVVRSLADCEKQLAEKHFEIVLLDLGLPDAHGLDALHAVRHRVPNIPVLVLTGRDAEDIGAQAMEAGANDYLNKNQARTPLLAMLVRYAIDRFKLQATAQESIRKAEQARELKAVGQLAEGPALPISARMFASRPIRVAWPVEFHELAVGYQQYLEKAVAERTYKAPLLSASSEVLNELAHRAGALRAGPRDIIEIHCEGLRSAIAAAPAAKGTAFIEESRLAALELMGHLASFYRHYYATNRSLTTEGATP